MRFYIGKLYYIRFLDHVDGDSKAAPTVAIGRLHSRSRRGQALTFCYWWYPGDDFAKQDSLFTILRSTITRAVELREVRR